METRIALLGLAMVACAGQGAVETRFVCGTAEEQPSAGAIAALPHAGFSSECAAAIARQLEILGRHRECAVDSDCFARDLRFVPDLGCVAASRKSAAARQAYADLLSLDDRDAVCGDIANDYIRVGPCVSACRDQQCVTPIARVVQTGKCSH
jgi:hypothetical protein